MTRKRKADQVEGSNWKREEKKEESKETYGENDFNSKYGYVGGGGQDAVLESVLEGGEGAAEGKGTMPVEILTYLRNVLEAIANGEEKSDLLVSRCVEECKGEEEKLMAFHDSCVVLERLLSDSALGATQFLRALNGVKRKRLLELMFIGCSSRLLDTLLYALAPVDKNEQVEILNVWCELASENFVDVCFDRNASFVVRALLRLTCGLPKPEREEKGGKHEKHEKKEEERSHFTSKEMSVELEKIRERLFLLASDFTLLQDKLDDSCVSLVVQTALDCDGAVKGRAADRIAQATLDITATDNGEFFIKSLQGKNSSRVWEKIFSQCSEESRERLWQLGVSGENLRACLQHSTAFFPIQALVRNVRSLQLASDVVDELEEMLEEQLKEGRVAIATALVHCVHRHDELQGRVVKAFRRIFHASKVSNKLNFLLNVLTWRIEESEKELSVDKATVYGSCVVESLLTLPHSKSLQECALALPHPTVREMALHRVASHVVQHFLRAPTVSDDTKNHMIKAFENHWQELIDSPCGSFVFESVWECSAFDVARKQHLMKYLIGKHSTSKSWKFTMFKIDAHLFKKNLGEWLKKWKEPGKQSAKKARRQEKIKRKREKKNNRGKEKNK